MQMGTTAILSEICINGSGVQAGAFLKLNRNNMNTVTDNVTEGKWIEISRDSDGEDLNIRIGIEGDWRPILTVHFRPNGDIQYSHDEAEANAKAVLDAVNNRNKP